MRVIRSMHPGWLSNTWLLADREGGKACLIDSGGPTEAIDQAIADWQVELLYVLCSHHHYDHIANNRHYLEHYNAQIAAHPSELERIDGGSLALEDGAEVEVGRLRLRALHIPGHTLGQLAFAIDSEAAVFTGDTLFRGSVGGTRGPGHTTYQDLHHSIMQRLMQLPHDWTVYPGHELETSIGREWEHNPFIRIWRGLDPEGDERCTVSGEPGQLVLWADDYDGGHKAWVRFDVAGDDVVPGSRVRR